jgi:hypothetical protein
MATSYLRSLNPRRLLFVVFVGVFCFMITLGLPRSSGGRAGESIDASSAGGQMVSSDSTSDDSSQRAGFAGIVDKLFGSSRSSDDDDDNNDTNLPAGNGSFPRFSFSLLTSQDVIREQQLKLDDPWDAPLPLTAPLRERLGRLKAIGLPLDEGGKGDLQPHEWVMENMKVSKTPGARGKWWPSGR